MTRLRFVVTLNPSKAEAGDLASYGNVTFAPMDALADGLGGLDTSLEKPAEELAASNYSYFAEGDLLIAKVTPCFENGKKALVTSLPNRIGFATSEVHVVRPNTERIDPNYLRYLLSSEAFRAAGIASMTGAGGLRRISDNSIKDFRPPTDDLQNQKAIASYLDRETGRIDQLVAKKELQVALVLEKEARVLDGLTFGSPLAGGLKPIPFKWICRVPNGQVDPAQEPWADLPLIAPNHIESGTGRLVSIETAKEQGADSGKYAFPAGTVVYSKIRPALAKACIVPVAGLCSADMYPIVPDRRLLPQFLLMQLLSRTFTAWATTESMRVAMPKINRDTLGIFRLLVPAVEDQQAAIDAWTANRARIEATRHAISKAIAVLRDRRTALITAALTGQIDVREKVAVTTKPDRSRFRLIVGSEIVHRHRDTRRFGRIKNQKLLYLAEAYAGISELGGNYIRFAAGPYDEALIKETERGMEAAAYYRAQPANGDSRGVTYVPLAKAGQHGADLKTLLGDRTDALRRLIDVLRDFDTEAVEAIATLYAVWNDALMDGKTPDDAALIRGVLREWHPDKMKFADDALAHWLAWMRRNGLVPRGQGPRTAHIMTGDLFA